MCLEKLRKFLTVEISESTVLDLQRELTIKERTPKALGYLLLRLCPWFPSPPSGDVGDRGGQALLQSYRRWVCLLRPIAEPPGEIAPDEDQRIGLNRTIQDQPLGH